jgi:cyclophilin family peptidyl-prolyl cis-trans isomerase
MPSEKRQRQDEGRLSRLEQQQLAQRHAQRRRQLRSLGLLLGGLLVVAFLISVVSGGDNKKTDVSAQGSSTTTPDSTAPDGSSPVEVVLPGKGASITGDTPCPPADGSAKRTTGFEKAPPTCIKDGATYTATIDTTEGTVVVDLDAKAAPVTVNNFVVLARYHFYENVPFHRIIPGFMDQAGDPVGPTPGQGGPGYTIPDELPTGDAPYPAGTLAMANKSAPDTGGSQWFIVVGDGGKQLTPTYTVFGHVTEGQDVVDAINKFGDAATNGTPTKLVSIRRITITER